jgi:DMSO reductase anchor subunit
MRRGERSMVPRADFRSYYGRPILKQPTWEARDIAGYLFLGGLAGASSTLAAGAHLTSRPRFARASKVGALGAISLSTAALVHDLGRPARFANMLRVFKPTSPMSVGSWLLAAYAPAAGVAATSAVSGRMRAVGSAATMGAGLLGPAVASYTAVLVANTAVPAWHAGHRELPFVFAGSAASAAAGLALLASPANEVGPAQRVAVAATIVEQTALKRLKDNAGEVAETFEQGPAGKLLDIASGLSVAGAVGALFARRSRIAGAISGACLLASSACTRFGIFAAGRASVADPKYVVKAQR